MLSNDLLQLFLKQHRKLYGILFSKVTWSKLKLSFGANFSEMCLVLTQMNIFLILTLHKATPKNLKIVSIPDKNTTH